MYKQPKDVEEQVFGQSWTQKILSTLKNYKKLQNNAQSDTSKSSDTVIDGYKHFKKYFEFRLYFANGGKIIELSRYNSSIQDREWDLYVISDDDSIGEAIDKIITFGAMK